MPRVYHALGLTMHQPLGNLIQLHNSLERHEVRQILWCYDRVILSGWRRESWAFPEQTQFFPHAGATGCAALGRIAACAASRFLLCPSSPGEAIMRPGRG